MSTIKPPCGEIVRSFAGCAAERACIEDSTCRGAPPRRACGIETGRETVDGELFADAVDTVQNVHLTYDALIKEVDVFKMRAFLSDVLRAVLACSRAMDVSIPDECDVSVTFDEPLG